MTDFQIIEPSAYHCGRMIRILRSEHKDALDNLGVNAHRELRAMFDASAFRRGWLIDGKLAGLGGVAGAALESSGYVWVALSKAARKYPVRLIKTIQEQLAEIMATRRELATTIIPEDDAAMRLAVFMGFHVAHQGRGQRAYSSWSRRDLVRYLKENRELRIPVGNGEAVMMGYHDGD